MRIELLVVICMLALLLAAWALDYGSEERAAAHYKSMVCAKAWSEYKKLKPNCEVGSVSAERSPL